MPGRPRTPPASSASAAPPRPRRGVAAEARRSSPSCDRLWAAPLAAELGSRCVRDGRCGRAAADARAAVGPAQPLPRSPGWPARARPASARLALGAVAIVALPTARSGRPASSPAADRDLDRRHDPDPARVVRGLRRARRGGDPRDLPPPGRAGPGRDGDLDLGRDGARGAPRRRRRSRCPGSLEPRLPGRTDRRGRRAPHRLGPQRRAWTAGTSPALALLPSTVASLWAGHRLWTLEHLIPRAVAGVRGGQHAGARRSRAARSARCWARSRGSSG